MIDAGDNDRKLCSLLLKLSMERAMIEHLLNRDGVGLMFILMSNFNNLVLFKFDASREKFGI